MSFDLEGLVFELCDEFLHVFYQFLVAYAVLMLLHGELLPVHIGNRTYDRQIVGRDIPCLLSVADMNDTVASRFACILFILPIQYGIFAGLLANRVVPQDPLSFPESCCHNFCIYFVSSGISFPE